MQIPHLVVTIKFVTIEQQSAATYTAHACKKQKGSQLIIVLYGKACLHSWLYSYHGLCKPHSWLNYNRWLEHFLFNKFPPLGSNIMGSKDHNINHTTITILYSLL